jgi:hypothetical protein
MCTLRNELSFTHVLTPCFRPNRHKADGSARDQSSSAEIDPFPEDEPIQWTKEEKQELEFGSHLGASFTVLVLAIYLKTMHPTVAGGDSG